jgi:hypothetical protein
MHEHLGTTAGSESQTSEDKPTLEPAPLRDERYEYRLELVERCRAELQRVTIAGEIAVILDPENDAFAGGLCRMLGGAGNALTFASLPAESLIVGLGSANPELAKALEAPPPVGFSWVVVVGRGSAGMALFPTCGSALN